MIFSRRSLILLLIAQCALILPHVGRLPFWTLIAWFGAAAWVFQIWQGHRGFPPARVKAVLVALSVGGVFFEFRNPAELEPLTAILISAYILKLLELKSERDQWVLVYLGYFLLALTFLFEQDMVFVLVATAQLLLMMIAQISLTSTGVPTTTMLGRVSVMLAQSVPLMIVMFVLFPRIAPLWSMPLAGESGRTGLSDSMSPGDISRLTKSTELAFRAQFRGDIPATSELYWRGLVLEQFDGRTWRRGWKDQGSPKYQTPKGESLRYEVTVQPGVHTWLHALPYAVIARPDIVQDRRYQLLPDEPLTGRLRYSVTSYLESPLSEEGVVASLVLNKRLPPAVNPRTRALGEQWLRDYPNTEERIAEAVRWWRAQELIYTLTPPKLGANTVDEFLFGTKQGFCEHFAGAFVFSMRAAGVPARVVLGYQGGEYNRYNDYLMVYQSDAHAWAEVWNGERWQRIDPTGFVAPERVRDGALAALAGQAGFFTDGISLRGFRWANRMRYWLDSVEYGWARFVLNYDSKARDALMGAWLGGAQGGQLIAVVLAAFFMPLIVITAWTLWRQPRATVDPLVVAYERCCARLARYDVYREPNETPSDFYQRAARRCPACEVWLQDVTRLFMDAHYKPCGSTAGSSEPNPESTVSRLKALSRRNPAAYEGSQT